MSYDTSLFYTNPYDISIFYVYDILTFKVTGSAKKFCKIEISDIMLTE